MSRWAELPIKLLLITVKYIDSPVDVLRFRAVCSSWRSSASLPSFDKRIPRPTLMLPQPIREGAALFPCTICIMEEDVGESPNSSRSKSWLVKVGESEYGKLQLFNPLTNKRIDPSKLNMLNFKFVQLNKSFLLQSAKDGLSVFGVSKVVPFPVSANYGNEHELGILAIYHAGKLGYWRYGDNNWIFLGDPDTEYDDIIVHKEQVYVVDRFGTVFWVGSSLKVVKYSPNVYASGGKKNLVESCGDLYIVDRYLDGKRWSWEDYMEVMDAIGNWRFNARNSVGHYPKAVNFTVYKLDEQGAGWDNVKSLGDRAFVLGIDCSFSVSCNKFNGGGGNCIYFMNADGYLGRRPCADSIHVFQLEDCAIQKLTAMPELSEIFCPAQPTWYGSSKTFT